MNKRKSGPRTPSVTPPGGKSTRPMGARTPALGTRLPSLKAVTEEPPWKNRARLLALALSEVIEDDDPDPMQIASVERAVMAWDLGGTELSLIQRVAYLVERAHVAMHGNRTAPTEQSLQGGAHILYNGLPSRVKKRVDFPQVLVLVRRLAGEREPWPAIVRATVDLLGWNAAALTQAGHIIRIAMASRMESIS